MDYESTPDFDANFHKLTSKNKALEVRLLKKIGQILDNPSICTLSVTSSKYARGSHSVRPPRHQETLGTIQGFSLSSPKAFYLEL